MNGFSFRWYIELFRDSQTLKRAEQYNYSRRHLALILNVIALRRPMLSRMKGNI